MMMNIYIICVAFIFVSLDALIQTIIEVKHDRQHNDE